MSAQRFSGFYAITLDVGWNGEGENTTLRRGVTLDN